MKPKIHDLVVAAGIEWIDMSHQWVADDEDIERFAELVRQDERERIGLFDNEENDDWVVGQVAKAIRAKGEK